MSSPRSLVPSGCAIVGVWLRSAKLISFTGLVHTNGPTAQATTRNVNTTSPNIASRCRRNCRQASDHSVRGLPEKAASNGTAGASIVVADGVAIGPLLAVLDARVED